MKKKTSLILSCVFLVDFAAVITISSGQNFINYIKIPESVLWIMLITLFPTFLFGISFTMVNIVIRIAVKGNDIEKLKGNPIIWRD
ncbi:hypothetical protein [Roseibium suaedae]|uniref:hypothetical protein n=1 Tax=Roseibium suaedae TaxID=735517 RepID=UPI001AD905B2|nr:hypothetical protein [Roseibium suaedae]